MLQHVGRPNGYTRAPADFRVRPHFCGESFTAQRETPMKKTDLYKSLKLKIDGQMKNAATPDRFGQAALPDRKEQRRLDQEKGLIPFAVKIDSALAAELRTTAQERGVELNELVGELLRKGLSA
jgi:hypothetical protein